MKELYVVNCCRTAIGSFGGSLKNTPAVDMGAIVVKEALKRANVAPENVDELMFGCILTAGQGQNPARQVSVKAGIPYSVPAYTVGMVCGSGMKSVIEGARSILAGDSDIVVCGGTENMSAAPYTLPDERWGARMSDKKVVDEMIKDGLWDAFNNYHMGTTAENINDIWGITRREQDEFAAASQQKACAARDSGRFDDEIVPVPVKVKKEIVEFKRDEYPKENVTADSIAKLRGAFPVGPESPNPQVVNTFEPTGIQDAEDKGTPRVTAANASGINDGAAAIVLASGEAVEKYGLKPMVKLIGWGQGGVDPKIMGVGPVVASRAAMAKAGVKIEDIDLVEANEAFAAQSIAVARELHFDMSKVNVNGGAIALGHPVGASGARIIVTLIHEMMKRPEAKKGLATLCIGGGMGTAVVVEKITVKSKENEKRTAAKAAVLFSFIGESLCGVIPGGRTVEHFLYHGLEGIDHRALGDISGCALDLIALKALGVIYRDSDFPMIGGDVLQGCVQKHIPHHQLALRGHVLEGDGHNVGLTVHTGSKVSSFTAFSFSMMISSLYFGPRGPSAALIISRI